MLRLGRRIVYRWMEAPWSNKGRDVYDYMIFKVDRLGDFILASSAIRLLIQALAGARICLVVSDMVLPWALKWFPGIPVYGIPNIDRLQLSKTVVSVLNARRLLRSITAKQIIILRHQRSNYHALVLRWFHEAKTIGYLPDHAPWLGESAVTSKGLLALHKYVKPVSHETATMSDHILSRELWWHFAVTRYFVPHVRPEDMLPFVPASEIDLTNNTDKKYLVLSPLGSNRIRDYPLNLVVSFIRAIQDALGDDFILFKIIGTDAQRLRLESGLAPLQEALTLNKVSIHSHLSISEYIHILTKAAAVISVETATAHIALALRRPTIVLAGGGHYNHFGPWTCADQQEWVTHQIPCFNCNWACNRAEPECITRIDPHMVSKTILAWVR